MNQKVEELKKLFETNPACITALSLLSSGVEIGIELVGGPVCALRAEKTGPKFFIRPAENPDVVFVITPEGCDSLCKNPPENPEDFAVAVLKQIKNRHLSIRVPGSYLGIATKGYLSIIKLGGKKMWDYLTDHGITNIFKITGLIKDMIKRGK